MTSPTETITAKELAESMKTVKTTILRRAEREKWPYENGKNRIKRFIINKLPEDVRLALTTRPLPAPSPRAEISTLPSPISPLTPRSVGSPELTTRQNRIALAWADLIRVYLQEKKRAKSERGQSIVEAAKLFIEGYNTGQLYPMIFSILGPKSFQTIEAKTKKFRDNNYDFVALAPNWGNRRGQNKVTNNEFNSLLSFALTPNRLRFSQITRLTKMSLSKRSISSPSSEATLRRAIEDWRDTHYDQWIFCREGEKALNDKCLPPIERDAWRLDVGDVLVADGHTLNFQILNPFTGKPARMNMVVWYDWASRMPAGWEIMPTENVQCVAAGLRRAIMALGKMPKIVYLDNGRAFKAKIFTDQGIDFEEAGFYGMFARLGIRTAFAWPYNAQSKVVERFFGTFSELERLMPTFTGTSIEDKPPHILRNEKLHKKLHIKKYNGWVPTVAEANEIIAGWTAEYAGRTQRDLRGLCPGEIFQAGRGEGIDPIALRFLMMSMETKSVGRSGIRFQGRNFYDDALYGYKHRVMIRYDLGEPDSIQVFDLTGHKFICEAHAVQRVHPMAKLTGKKEDIQAVSDGINRKRSLKKGTEAAARAFIEAAPALIAIPRHTQDHEKKTADVRASSQLTRAEAEHIEAEAAKMTAETREVHVPGQLTEAEAKHIETEAAKMTVLEWKPKEPEPDPLCMDIYARYEYLLERECRGEDLELKNMEFLRWFEKNEMTPGLKARFDFLSELWIAGPESEEIIK